MERFPSIPANENYVYTDGARVTRRSVSGPADLRPQNSGGAVKYRLLSIRHSSQLEFFFRPTIRKNVFAANLGWSKPLTRQKLERHQPGPHPGILLYPANLETICRRDRKRENKIAESYMRWGFVPWKVRYVLDG